MGDQLSAVSCAVCNPSLAAQPGRAGLCQGVQEEVFVSPWERLWLELMAWPV